MTWRRLATTLVSIAAAAFCAEVATRAVDGYELASFRLRRVSYAEPGGTPDRKYLPAIPLAPGIDAAWYEQDPPSIPRVPMTHDIEKRYEANAANGYNAFMVWNSVYVPKRLCTSTDNGITTFGDLHDFYLFDPPDQQPYPVYRHIPGISPPNWFVVNSFGWRGPDFNETRPPGVIRLAFVGASTTVDPYYAPFSHIELIGMWLNEWAAARGVPFRFETLNAARTGIDSSSIREIVRQEVLSADPDLIVYYEGANDFAPGKALRQPEELPKAPSATFHSRGKAEEYSAVAARVFDAVLKFTGRGGYEPRKPSYPLKWVDGVSEYDPDISRPQLPMDQQVIVRNLEAMQAAAAANGTDFAVASFTWMVHPGMRLDLAQHLILFRYLNESYWPSSYEHIRRMADFQNRVFRAFTRKHGATYLPMDEAYPHDPDLFGDAIHMTDRGRRLQAWIYTMQLIPLIESHIASHRWPKSPPAQPVSAAWRRARPRLASRDSLRASCQAVH